MEISLFKILLIMVLFFAIFGAGKLPQMMSDLGKGIKSLKEGMHGDAKKPEEPRQLADTEKDKTRPL